MSADRNLLFGILALQMDFISKDALIQAMHAWVLDKVKPLGQILVEQGALAAENQVLLDTLVQRHLALHDNDLSRSLATIPPAGSIREELQRIADPDLLASLAHVGTMPSVNGDPHASGSPLSLGTHTSAGLRFRIVRPHAKGGLGEVFVAVDEELRREVALKEIQLRYADDAESRTRFVREAEITGGLEHPGVVPVHGLGEYPDGRPFYAMRFIRGESLQAAIDRFHNAEKAGRAPGEHNLELRQLLGRFIAVCNTMAYVHSPGVIHRDLKPSNIMLGPYAETMVVDWGLVKVIGQPEGTEGAAEPCLATVAENDSNLTQAGRALGTPAFMSPEQAAGRLDQLGPASDGYSLGATLYCLLTGKAPFSGTDVGVVLTQVQSGDFPPPRQRNASVPAALEAICLKAMALKPEERYESAKALADDLEHWLADEPVTAFAEPWRARLRRWVRQHKGLVGTAAAAGMMVVTMAVAWALVTAAQAREGREQALCGEAEGQRGLVQRLLYFSRINLADRAWHDSQMVRMDELLQHQQETLPGQEDMRGFEWHYLWRLRHCWLLNCQGHTDHVQSVAFSPDGRRLASASRDKTVKVWDATTGQETISVKGHTGWVSGVAFSPDGRRLASASWDKTVKVWDAATGKETLSLMGHTSWVSGVTFSPDGRRLASAAADHTVRVWDAATGKEALSLKGHTGWVKSVTFSPDGRRLASAAADHTVRVWDATTGQETLILKGHASYVFGVTFSPDGRRLASGSFDQTVKVWDATTGQETFTLKGHRSSVVSVTFSPDGRHLVSAGGSELKVWDVTTGQEAFSLKGHTSVVTSVAFNPDGRRLASGSQDRTVKVWDATAGQETLSFKGHTKFVNSVAFSPDGRRLASGGGNPLISGEVKVWDAATGQEELSLQGHTNWVQSVTFSPDGRRLVSASWDKTVKVWDATTGQQTLTLKGHKTLVNSVTFSPDGQHLASASEDGTVRVWDARTGHEVLTLKGHLSGVTSVTYSPDGRRLASASYDQTVKIWDAATGQEQLTLKGHTILFNAVTFSPDNLRLASAAHDQTVKVWDATTGEEQLTLKGHANTVWSVSFSPDGRRLASASADNTVKVWDATTGQEALTLKGHTDAVKCITFSPDGRRLASASSDGTVKIWDAAPSP